jgi:RTX calcium-binding nonapeptide repeat (4 copies)
MTEAEVAELQIALQTAIGLGASPDAIQPINDFINVTVGPPAAVAVVEQPVPTHLTPEQIATLNGAVQEAIANGASAESMKPVTDFVEKVSAAPQATEPAPDTVTGGAGNDTIAGGAGNDTASGGAGTTSGGAGTTTGGAA